MKKKKHAKFTKVIIIFAVLISLVYGVFLYRFLFPVAPVFDVQPLPSMERTSDYGTYFIVIPHYGIDVTGLGGNGNADVKSPVSARVKRVNDDCGKGSLGDFCGYGYGNTIELETADYIIIFGHLEQHTFHVKAGDQVKAGDLLAKVGFSGNSTGPHLHYEVRQKPGVIIWQTINPEKITYQKGYN